MEVCSVGDSAGRLETSEASKLDNEPSNKPNFDERDAASASRVLKEVEPCSPKSFSDWSIGEIHQPVCCSDATSLLMDAEPEKNSVCLTEEAAKPKVPASGARRIFRRIQKFFTRVATACFCCWHPNVEDWLFLCFEFAMHYLFDSINKK